MKVRVVLTLDIDAEAWALEFGPNTPVREDVHTYVTYIVQETLKEAGVLADKKER